MQEIILQALRQNAVHDAVATANDWVSAEPQNADAHYWLAISCKAENNHELALQHLDTAIRLAPENARLHLERASILLRINKLDEAQTALAQSTGLDPNLFPAYLAQAQLALGRGDLEEATRFSKTAARIVPNHPQLLAVDGMVALRQDDADRALALLSQAYSQLPDDMPILYSLGFAYIGKQHWGFAEQAFRKVLENLPEAVGLQVLIAQLAQRQQRSPEALEILQNLLKIPDYDNADIHRLAGESAIESGQVDIALEHLQIALKTLPDDRRTLQALLMAWRQKGNIYEARATLEMALQATTQSHDLWLARLALEPIGEEGAREVVERWVAAMPEHIPALEAQMRIFDWANEHNAAIAVAHKIIQLEPGRLSAESCIVEGFLRTNPPAATAHVQALLDKTTVLQERTLLQNWLGRVHAQIGNHQQAIDLWLDVHQSLASQRLPLPPNNPAPKSYPELAASSRAIGYPLFLWGLPGSRVEYLAQAFSEVRAPVRDDRLGPTPPEDGFQNYHAPAALLESKVTAENFIAEWKHKLSQRNIQNQQIIDWLLFWDNAFLLGMRSHLPEGILLIALRDPRDMLLEWLGFGSPVPFGLKDIGEAANWLMIQCQNILELQKNNLYPHRIIRLDHAGNDPRAISQLLSEALNTSFPIPANIGQPRLSAGKWRDYRFILKDAFAVLTPVAMKLGYTEY